MILKYKCENEACPEYEKVVEVPQGKSAECPGCGWFLTSILD